METTVDFTLLTVDDYHDALARYDRRLRKVAWMLSFVKLFAAFIPKVLIAILTRRIRTNLFVPLLLLSWDLFSQLCVYGAKEPVSKTNPLLPVIELTLHRNSLVFLLLQQVQDKKFRSSYTLKNVIDICKANNEYLSYIRLWLQRKSFSRAAAHSSRQRRSNTIGFHEVDLRAFMREN